MKRRILDATKSSKPVVVKGGRAVAFTIVAAGYDVGCMVTRVVLEQYFRLQRGAGTLQVPRTRMRQQLVRALIVDIVADVDLPKRWRSSEAWQFDGPIRTLPRR